MIRLQINLTTAPPQTIPINYQYELSGWIYRTLQKADQAYSGWLHEGGYAFDNRHFKLFCFSRLQVEKRQPQGDRLVLLSDRARLEVGFAAPAAAQRFLTGLFADERFTLGDRRSQGAFAVSSVRPHPAAAEETLEQAALSTASPLLLTRLGERHAQYLSPDGPGYGRALLLNLWRKYRSAWQEGGLLPEGAPALEGYDPAPSDFELLDRPRSRLITIKVGTPEQTKLRGFDCRFRLSAPAPLIAFGLAAGFGEKNAVGFGCCRI